MPTLSQSSLRARIHAALEARVTVDARALAALRIALGALLLADLALRSVALVAFYTDAGVLPRAVLSTQSPTFSQLSIHALWGSATAQAILFAIAGVFALLLLVGYRSRLAAIVSFVLLVSLQARNPVVLNGGDTLLRHLLLWGMFLPLGSRWSIDAMRTDNRPERVASVATAGLLLQVVLVYATNAILKLRGEAWPGGDAVGQVMALTRFATPLGQALQEVPLLLTAGTYLWLGLLVASPLLVLATDRIRSVLAGLFVLVHAGMAATLEIYLFPVVSIAGFLPFFGPEVWDRVPHPPGAPGRQLDAILPAVRSPWSLPRLRRVGAALGVAIPALLVCSLLVVNAVSVGYLSLPPGAPDALEEKGWSMFAPEPPIDDGWYVFPATLESGRQVDALRGGSVAWDRPPDVSTIYPTYRWKKLLSEMRAGDETSLHRPLARHLCQRWNQSHEEEMTQVRIVYVEYHVGKSNAGERRDFGRFDCQAAG